MASNLASPDVTQSRARSDSGAAGMRDTLFRLIAPLASLKLTVVLFAMAIFLVLAGTVAQIDDDIWVVMSQYFRTPLAWIPLRVFFPRSLDVPGVIPFPGGWTIGGLLMVNLIAAHLTRFKVQARGFRLWAGVGIIALGVLTTWVVITSGSNQAGTEGLPVLEWSTMWELFRFALVVLGLTAIGGAVAVGRERRVERLLLAIIGLGLSGLAAWLYLRGGEAPVGASSLRILWQLIKGATAGMVLLAGCILVFRKRAGIVLLHAGVGLMMFNELYVGLTNVEAQMYIHEGQTTNFVRDIRDVELAVIDTSPADTDLVTVIPRSLWQEGDTIRDERLPFDIEVLRYMPNAALRDATKLAPGVDNPATAGLGKSTVAQEIAASTGTDNDAAVDTRAAYVRLLDKKTHAPLGTHLVSVLQDTENLPETVTVGDKTYEIALRFRRDYLPYSLRLLDASQTTYEGTNKAKDYSSHVRLVDPQHEVDRPVHIWMNNPLRYAGETFYQSEMRFGPQGTQTVLQVVTNTGWMIPYVGCMLVVVGMLAHFLGVLVRFLNRQEAVVPAKTPTARKSFAPAELSPWYVRWGFPLAVVALFGGYVLSKARPPKSPPGSLNLYAFGQLPVVYEGRVQPFDSLARNSLRVISGKEEWKDEEGHKQPAIRWLLDVMTSPYRASQHQVIRIDSLEVLDTLGLKRREGSMYSIQEIREQMPEFERQVIQAQGLKQDEQSSYQRKVLELDQRLRLLTLLLKSFDQTQIRTDSKEHVLADINAAIKDSQQLMANQPPLAVPPAAGETHWEPYASAWTKAWAQANMMRREPNPALVDLNGILVAYAKGDAPAFNDGVKDYAAKLAAAPPPMYNRGKVQTETFFNSAAPFYYSLVPYLVAFVLTCLGWLGWRQPLHRAAFWLIAFTFVVHSIALVMRIYISGRPPVTNLYSSAIFIGWGGVLLGMILEFFFRLGVGNIVAAVSGFATLLIAHTLSGTGDTFVVLQAVLDTQFWLATHVVCITLGYTTTYVAGLLGLVYVGASAARKFGAQLPDDLGRTLARMIYGVLCFAILFSFFGTVLGGLWADDSWGRFWGWDPKENGALMIVIWNALVLHARWGGMVKDRGLALLAVAGNIAVSWSWFGVNNLGKGLHSYGFTEGVAWALLIFAISQVLIIIAGAMLPRLGERT